MTRVAYLDCFSGVSGDMLLGATVDAGVPLADLRTELEKIPLEGYRLDSQRVTRGGLAATQVMVDVGEDQSPRTLQDVLSIVGSSSVPTSDREKGSRVFTRLAEAEAKVHGETVETVHLHDVGAVDAIVDVMGTIAGWRLLGIDDVYASPLPTGEGTANGPHGPLPLPAPATLELLSRAKAPLRRPDGATGELVTPTGAAIVTTLATFGRPEMTLDRIGYGAGSRDPADRPNVLRMWIGEGAEAPTRSMVLIETNIDDMTGELLGYVQEKLMSEGAADAWFTPIQMKKGRPALMLSVICTEGDEARVAKTILRETSTLGVRVRPVTRHEAEREELQFESSLGPAAVKVKRLPGRPPSVAPEYEACARIARERGLPLWEVYRIVEREARRQLSD
ncbi:MAG: nickel pincer cofactor biosynthesis protein LarC [Chloroflexi bacterium]|nr:nickel pincer cofactor biosynthesis protein LarC [Chloroflexota bacterium]